MTEELTPAPPPDGPSAAPPPKRSRLRRIVAILITLVVVLVGGAFGASWFLDNQIASSVEWIEDPFGALPSRPPSYTAPATPTPTLSPTPGTTERPVPEVAELAPVNILVLGSDSRISAGDPSLWEQGAQRTDTIMLVHLTANRGRVYAMSIPRDSWVPIPGHGEAKINAAFSYGGPSLTIQTVEQLTGVRIDHIVLADFDSFARLTDLFGGVEITIPEATYDRRRGETIPAGTYLMNGEEALDYVRQRYGLPGGDFDRVERQQNWLRSIAATAIDQGVLDDPVALTRTLLAIKDSIAADEEFTVDRMRELALSARPVDEVRDIVFFTAPVAGTGWSPDGTQSIVRLDQERFDRVSEAMATDTIWRFLDIHPGYIKTLGEWVD